MTIGSFVAVEHLLRGASPSNDARASAFYGGAEPRWSDIVGCLDVSRTVPAGLADALNGTPAPDVSLLVLLGHPRGGKSTLLRRLAANLAAARPGHVFWLADGDLPGDLSGLGSEPGPLFLFVDDASRLPKAAWDDLLNTTRQSKRPVVIVATESRRLWTPVSSREVRHDLPKLTEEEVRLVVERWVERGCQGRIADHENPGADAYLVTGGNLGDLLALANGRWTDNHRYRETLAAQPAEREWALLTHLALASRLRLSTPLPMLGTLGFDNEEIASILYKHHSILEENEDGRMRTRSFGLACLLTAGATTDHEGRAPFKQLSAQWLQAWRAAGLEWAALDHRENVMRRWLPVNLPIHPWQWRPDHPAFLRQRAMAAARERDYPKARRLFRDVVEEYPTDQAALAAWARMEFDCGHPDNGHALFERAIQQDESDPRPYTEYARCVAESKGDLGSPAEVRSALGILERGAQATRGHLSIRLAWQELTQRFMPAASSEELGVLLVSCANVAELFQVEAVADPIKEHRKVRHRRLAHLRKEAGPSAQPEDRRLLEARALAQELHAEDPEDVPVLAEWAQVEWLLGNRGDPADPPEYSSHWLFQRAVQSGDPRPHAYVQYMLRLYQGLNRIGTDCKDPDWTPMRVYCLGNEACGDEISLLRTWMTLCNKVNRGLQELPFSLVKTADALTGLVEPERASARDEGSQPTRVALARQQWEQRREGGAVVDSNSPRGILAQAIADEPWEAKWYNQWAALELEHATDEEKKAETRAQVRQLLHWSTLLDPLMPHGWRLLATMRADEEASAGALKEVKVRDQVQRAPNDDSADPVEWLVSGADSARYAAWRSICFADTQRYDAHSFLSSWATMEVRAKYPLFAHALWSRAIRRLKARDDLNASQKSDLSRMYCSLGWLAGSRNISWATHQGGDDSVGAIRHYEQAVRVDPGNPHAWRGLTQSQARAGLWEPAARSLQSWKDLDSRVEFSADADLVEVQAAAAKLAVSKPDALDHPAVQALITTIKDAHFAASKGVGYCALADYWLATGRHDDWALTAALDAVLADQTCARGYFLVCSSRLAQGNVDGACQAFLDAARLDPYRVIETSALCENLVRKSIADSGALPSRALEEALRIQAARTRDNWGVAKLAYQVAMEVHRRREALRLSTAPAGAALQLMRQRFDAFIELTLAIDPLNSFALTWRARDLIENRRIQEGVTVFARALQAYPRNDQAPVIIRKVRECLWAAQDEGDDGLVRQCEDGILKIDPRDPSALVRQAQRALRAGSIRVAVELAARVVADDASHPLAGPLLLEAMQADLESVSESGAWLHLEGIARAINGPDRTRAVISAWASVREQYAYKHAVDRPQWTVAALRHVLRYPGVEGRDKFAQRILPWVQEQVKLSFPWRHKVGSAASWWLTLQAELAATVQNVARAGPA